MKPVGPIPAGYETIAGELAVGGKRASELVAEAGRTPLFVYSAALIRARVAQLRSAMPERVALHYAVKANPYPPVLEAMAQGTPVVTSIGTSTQEVAGGAAILVDPLSEESIRNGIDEALRDADALKQRGRERASQTTWQKTAVATALIYDEVLNNEVVLL